MTRIVPILLATLGLASAAMAGDKPQRDAPPALTDKEAKTLAKLLDGKAPGKPQSCVGLSVSGSGGPTAISDSVLVYRVNRDLVYRNDLIGRCSGITRGSTLVLEPTGSQYCRGDIAHVVDLSIGMRGPSCVLGDFVPYRTVGK